MGQPISEFAATYYELHLFVRKAGGGRWEAWIETADKRVIKDPDTYGFEDDAKSAALEFAQEYFHQQPGEERPLLEHVEWLPAAEAMSTAR